jgi:DNA-binding MarR family transcriptional regulator
MGFMDYGKIPENPVRGKPSLQYIAAQYASHGLSIVVASPGNKVPLINWKAYQYEPPSSFEREAMFSFEQDLNIGVVCGIASDNLAIIDAETKEAFETQIRHCESAGIADTWIDETFRGGHILTKTPVPVKPKSFKKEGFEVRAQGQFVLLPPSTHPSGKVYRFINQPASIVRVPSLDALDWLKLEPAPHHKPLPRKAWQILQGERYDRYASRSEAEQAVVTTLVNSGFNFYETLALFRSYSPAKFTEIERRDPDKATQWLQLCYDQARAFCAVDSPARRFARAVQIKAELSPWPGRHGITSKAVFLAHTNLAHRSGQTSYHASSRDIAEIAGVARKTAANASRRLAASGLLELVQSATFSYANRYRLSEKTNIAPLLHIGLEGVGSTSSFLLPHAFRRRGLGHAVFEVMRALESGPLKAKEIAQRTGRHVQTVRKALLRMSRFGYAGKFQGRWTGKPLNEINLEELAKIVGTAGARKKQKERHRGERLRRRIAAMIRDANEHEEYPDFKIKVFVTAGVTR